MTPPRYEIIINGSQNNEHRHTQRGEHIQDVEREFKGADAVALDAQRQSTSVTNWCLLHDNLLDCRSAKADDF